MATGYTFAQIERTAGGFINTSLLMLQMHCDEWGAALAKRLICRGAAGVHKTHAIPGTIWDFDEGGGREDLHKHRARKERVWKVSLSAHFKEFHRAVVRHAWSLNAGLSGGNLTARVL
jgi:hypothetical protein